MDWGSSEEEQPNHTEGKKEVLFSLSTPSFAPQSNTSKSKKTRKKKRSKSSLKSALKKDLDLEEIDDSSSNTTTTPAVLIPTSKSVPNTSTASSLPTPASLLSVTLPTPPPPDQPDEEGAPAIPIPSNPFASGPPKSLSLSRFIQGFTAANFGASYNCPFCNEELNEAQLVLHVFERHAGDKTPVVCPICAAQPGGDPNYYSNDFHGHLRLRHKPRTLVSRYSGASSELIASPLAKVWGESKKSPANMWAYIMHMDILQNGYPSPSCCLCLSRTQLGHSAVILPCNHIFHTKCIEANSDPNMLAGVIPICPYCELNNKSAKIIQKDYF